MEKRIEELSARVQHDLAKAASSDSLAAFWQEYLSKNGAIPSLMKQLRSVAPEERPAAGKIINSFKARVTADYEAAAERIRAAELNARNAAEAVDITLPAKTRPAGALHPITLIKNQIIDAFAGMGFEIYEGPEIDLAHRGGGFDRAGGKAQHRGNGQPQAQKFLGCCPHHAHH